MEVISKDPFSNILKRSSHLQSSSTLADLDNGAGSVIAAAPSATTTTTSGVSGTSTSRDTGHFTRLGGPSPTSAEDNGNGSKLDAYHSYSPHHQQQQSHHHHAQLQSGYITATTSAGAPETPPLSSANVAPVTSIEAITTTSPQAHMIQQVYSHHGMQRECIHTGCPFSRTYITAS